MIPTQLPAKKRRYSFLRHNLIEVLAGTVFWTLICFVLIALFITWVWFKPQHMDWIHYPGQFATPTLSNPSFPFSLSQLLVFGLFLTGQAFPTLLFIFACYALRRIYRYSQRISSATYTGSAAITLIAAVWVLISYSAFFVSYPIYSDTHLNVPSIGIIGFEVVQVLHVFLDTQYSMIVIWLSMCLSTLLLFRWSPFYISEWIGTIVVACYRFYRKGTGQTHSLIQNIKLLFKYIRLELQKLAVLNYSKNTRSYPLYPPSQKSSPTRPDLSHRNPSSSFLRPQRHSSISAHNIQAATQPTERKATPFPSSADMANIPLQPNSTVIHRQPHISLPTHRTATPSTNISGELQSSDEFSQSLSHESQSLPADQTEIIEHTLILPAHEEPIEPIPPSAQEAEAVKTLMVDSIDISQNISLMSTPELPSENPLSNLSEASLEDNALLSNTTATAYDLNEYLPAAESDDTIHPTPISKATHVVTKVPKPSFEMWEDFPLPPISLLDTTPAEGLPPSDEVIHATSQKIEAALKSFGVCVDVKAAYPGPVITRYDIELASGIKGVQIVNLAKDLARSLAVISIRVVENIPGKPWMGLEVPNAQRQQVKLAEALLSDGFQHAKAPLSMAIGKDISGHPITLNLIKMPHLLVAGTTGSGKSVGLNNMIVSMLYKATPNEVRLVMIDPKMVELSVYADIPHLITPVITDMHQAHGALNWCVQEMERREQLLSKLGVRNITAFNDKLKEAQKKGQPIRNPIEIEALRLNDPESDVSSVPYLTPLAYLVIVVDEYADLFMVIGKKVEEVIARLAQKGRAGGVHLILATQRPSVDVVTGLIKANVPARIAFQVSTKVDSRTILDQQGAEALLGQGDMLYYRPGQPLQRLHGAYVTDEEVNMVADYLRSVCEPQYLVHTFEENDNARTNGNTQNSHDEYDTAVQVVLESKNASISSLQRRMNIGFNKAAKLIERMEKEGLVSAPQKNGKREILAPSSGF